MNYKNQILKKIANNTEVVGIIGLGYVGLPLAVNFAEAGIKTLGFDKNLDKVDRINHGSNYIEDIRDALLKEVVDSVSLSATTDFTRMKECDALIIAVPTPLDRFKKPDMSFIEAACTDIGRYMKPGTFISLESTTYPTTTEEVMLPIIEAASAQNTHWEHEFVPLSEGDEESARTTEGVPTEGEIPSTRERGHTNEPPKFIHGTDFWLAYSPERVDPGNKAFHTRN
ncbi:MAG: NAD(P)-binding domain-containing protein, partial [Tangfeifania sp.]